MKLEQIIERIPLATLERVVFDQDFVKEDVRVGIFKASGLTHPQIARRVVEEYDDQFPLLAQGLHDQVAHVDFELAEALQEHFETGPMDAGFSNHQANLVTRIPTLPLDELSEFLVGVRHHVCLVVATNKDGDVVTGTGFLVGEDLVLTCRHVLADFDPNADFRASGKQVEVYFDFYRGAPVDKLRAKLAARKVELAKDWHVASCTDTDPDGLDDPLSAADAKRIAAALDFIVVRLGEPVGRQPIKNGGGRRRGWISLPDDSIPQGLAKDDWIIIPQHPQGFPQRIDLGRYQAADQTKTRIRYKTNTAKGSSGAPCFNQRFKLVGVHNAYVGKPQPNANQAIRLDHISGQVRAQLQTPLDETYALRWSISRPGETSRVVIGRDKLLDWLQRSATAKPKMLADRVYAARGKESNAGCSFTIDVLLAELRDSKTPRAVYGPGRHQLPTSAEDFIASLLRELGITPGPTDALPPRPKPSEKSGPGPATGDIDQLSRWLSNELPEWVGRIISAHVEKQIDVRENTKKAVEALKAINAKVPEDLQEQADAKEPVWVRANAWDFAYVVIDGLRVSEYSGKGDRTPFSGEVRDLIAALVKGKPEEAMSSGLRRLRWMFLGYLPDFVPASAPEGAFATFEPLEPQAVDAAQVLAVFQRMLSAHKRDADAGPLAKLLAAQQIKAAEKSGDPRMPALQRVVSEAADDLLKAEGL